MLSDPPLTRDLVLIGGGHAHALVLRRWGMDPLPGARLTLVNPGPTAPYTGMLPGHVAGHYEREALDIDLVRLARFAGARLILGRAESLDPGRKRIGIAGRGEIGYDIVSLDIGITSEPPALPGFDEHGVAAKPLGRFADAWAAFRAAVARGEKPAEAAVIGGGVGGVELALAMAHALAADGQTPRVSVLERDRALREIGPAAERAVRAAAEAMGVAIVEAAEVAAVEAGAVRLFAGRMVPSAFTVGAAGARPYPWLAETGLPLEDGFVVVGDTLQSPADACVFAAGDCAHLAHAPRPKAGVFAVRAAPVLAANLRRALIARPGRWRRFRPQRSYLKLVSLGGRRAAADRAGLGLSGGWVWRWKDRIDRRFMDRFADLPAMAEAEPPAVAADGVRQTMLAGRPLCAGCGAKVGSATLERVLAGLPEPSRADILTGPGEDAALIRAGEVTLAASIDVLRAFTTDPWMLGRIAAVHALGDIWAMGAEPQAALASLVLPPMSPELQERTLEEIMAAAAGVFGPEGAAIVGGHSALGAELSVGFAVTGRFGGTGPLRLDGGAAGDALILTKPLGTGVLLAAEMAGRARGAWVAGALASMARPQGAAAAALARAAGAMTDVTGFGLAGHLLRLAGASGLGAEIRLDALPLLAGAVEVSEAGIRSTLYPENRAAAVSRMVLPEDRRTPLLFDPQTAGGLLAAVPQDRAGALIAALEAGGTPAVRIGRLTAPPVVLAVR